MSPSLWGSASRFKASRYHPVAFCQRTQDLQARPRGYLPLHVPGRWSIKSKPQRRVLTIVADCNERQGQSYLNLLYEFYFIVLSNSIHNKNKQIILSWDLELFISYSFKVFLIDINPLFFKNRRFQIDLHKLNWII